MSKRLMSKVKGRNWRVSLFAFVAIMASVFSTRPFAGGVPPANTIVVVAVPWQGSEAKPHPVISGGTVILQASASNNADGNPVGLISGTWDPGNGTGPQTINVSNSRILEFTATYSGPVGTPYTATIKVVDSSNVEHTDTFKVQVQPTTLETEANMAIDKGLWYTHKTMNTENSGGYTLGYWSGSVNNMANTSAAVQSYAVNGHRPTGSAFSDPYVDDVARGLRHLQNNLNRVPMGATLNQPSGTLGAATFFHHLDANAPGDTISPNLVLNRGIFDAMNQTGSDATQWSRGACTTSSTQRYNTFGDLYWNEFYYQAATGYQYDHEAVTGQTVCLIDTTTSKAYELTFTQWDGYDAAYVNLYGYWPCDYNSNDCYVPEGIGGGFSYNRRAYSGGVSQTFVPDLQGHAGTAADPGPDMNGNNYGLETNSGNQVYVGGQIIDAFVASGTPAATAVVGQEVGRTYKDIVQDLIDAYSFGQSDVAVNGTGGGWIYGWNDNYDTIDSSSSGWWGVGAHAAEVWGVTMPSWVKTLNLNNAIPKLQSNGDGSCGYRAGGEAWSQMSETTACMIMLSADGQSRTSTRFAAAETWVANAFGTRISPTPYGIEPSVSIYTMYNLTKSMRLAKDSAGNAAPITMLGGTIDWYGGLPVPGNRMDPKNGIAYNLIAGQRSDGKLATQNGQDIDDGLANSWGVLILSPSLFENGPVAVCSTTPNIVCQAGAPAGAGSCGTGAANTYATVSFDASQSTAGDNPIASYSWNFQDGGSTTDASTVQTSTTFANTGTYNVTVTVTDTHNIASTATCPVDVTAAALPPVAVAGGPYSMCIGTPSLTLNAGASVGRGSNIVSYEWDFSPAITFTPVDATGVTTNQGAYFNGLGVGTHDVGLRVTDDLGNKVIDYTTVTVNDCNPPVITVPSNITVTTNNPSAPVSYAVTVTDNVDTNPTAVCTSSPTAGLSSGSNFPVGTTTITCNSTDAAGNAATPKSFTVTVSNNQPPQIQVPANKIVEATSPNGAAVTYTATATDDHDTLTPNCNPASGSTFGINVNTSKTTTVNCSVTDSGNLSANAFFTVTVQDTTKPVLTVPGNLSVHALNQTGAIVTYATSASDIVDVTDPVNCDHPSGQNFPFGTTQVNCSSTDKHGNTGTASFTVTVSNAAPTAVNDSVTTHGTISINVLGNDSDPDGDPLIVSLPNGNATPNGNMFVAPDKTIQYTPNGGGLTDSFVYQISDGRGGTAAATVNVTITNGAPIAVNDTVTLPHNVTSFAIPVLGNDSDPEGDLLQITQAAVGNNCHCQPFTINNANGTITYNSQPGQFSSPAQFTYTIRDKFGATSTATVTVNFTNAAPSVTPFFVTTHGQPVTVNLLSHGSDPDGDTLALSGAACQPIPQTVGNCNFNTTTGAFTFFPNPQWFGPQFQVGFTINDGHSGTASSFVQIKYVNALPQVVPHEFTTQANTAITLHEGDILVGDTDADGDHLFVPNGVTISHGTLVPLPDGSDGGTFTPDLNFVGDAIITFVVDDDHGGQVHDTAVIHVVPAPSVTTISCPVSVVFNGAAQTGCTAHVTGNGGLDQSVPVTYSSNINVGTVTASAVFAGDTAHLTSNASTTFEITKAPSTTVVTCPTSLVYNGSALTPCTAHVTGVNLDADVTPVTHSNNIVVGTASATATYAGDDNHTTSTGNATFEITKAPSTTVVTCTPTTVYNGFAQQLCAAHVTGDGGLNADVTPVTYTANTNVGTAHATATYPGDANHADSTGSSTFEITKAAAACSVTSYSVTYNVVSHTATGACTGVRGESLAGLDLTGTTHSDAGTYTDAWTFTDVTGNYSNTNGSVTDTIAKAPTKTTLAVSSPTAAAGAPVTLTATVVSVVPGAGIPNGTVTFTEGATVLGSGTVNASGVATFTTTTLSNGPHTISATYNESANFLSSASNSVNTLIYGFAAGGGTFVISDTNATLNKAVNFWGSQWEKNNIPSGGSSNASFKGFATTPAAPTVGATFTASPGNSAPQPSTVPQYIGIIVTSKVTKSGSNISGTIVKLVVVKVDQGYVADPGHAGTGTIVAFIQ